MEGRGRGDGKPGKTGRVLIEDLKKGQNRFKKLDFFKNHKPSREKLEKKNNSVSSFLLPEGPENHSSHGLPPWGKNLFLTYIVQGIKCLLLKPMPFMG